MMQYVKFLDLNEKLGLAKPLPIGLLALGLLLLSFSLRLIFLRWRNRRAMQPPPQEEVEFINSEICLRGLRYPRARAKPILLLHGYGSNFYCWKEIGRYLYHQGFDVWMMNFRGHGLGKERSEIQDRSLRTNYSFQFLVTRDLPLMVESIYQRCQQPLRLIGHSMGGMAIRSFLAGVTENQAGQQTYYNEGQERVSAPLLQALELPYSARLNHCAALAQFLADHRLSSAVIIGSPLHFRHLPTYIRWMTRNLSALTRQLQKVIFAAANLGKKPVETQNLLSRIRQKTLERSRSLFLSLGISEKDWMKGVMNINNFESNSEELLHFLNHGLSQLPDDLAKDCNRWAQLGSAMSDSGFNFSTPRKCFVPLMMVAGDQDEVGPAEALFAEAESGVHFYPVIRVMMVRTSHMDLIVGKRAVEQLGPFLLRFFQDPLSMKS